jgi:hypothetical protein
MSASRLISVEWVAVAILIGVGLQVGGWLTGIGLLIGLPAYLLIGLLTGWASPGKTYLEPAIAAFLIASVGFVLDHLLLSLLGVGFVLALLYGVGGVVLALSGAYLGERFLDS